MKRLALLASIVLSFTAMAQEGPIISSAIIAIDRNNDVEEAKQYIDKAQGIIEGKPLSGVDEKDLSKFYFYKGKINYRIFNSKDPEVQQLDTNALDKALEGFTSLIEYEEKVDRDRYTEGAKEQLQYVANDIARRAISKSQQQQFREAHNDFLLTYNIKKSDAVGMTDTAMLYNAAIMAQNAGMFEKALELNKQLLEMGYKGVTYSATNPETGEETVFPNRRMMERMVQSGKFENPKAEGDIRADLYATVSGLALRTGDTATFEKTVSEGRQKFPNDDKLLKTELQIFLDKGEYDKALKNINEAVATAEGEDKVMMYYNKGVILQNEMDRPHEALKAYDQALEMDSTYSDALYMSSIIYIDSANAIGKEMNDLPLDATDKYEKLKKQQLEVFETALPYLEEAYKQSPEDKQVVTALRQVYRALKMYEKAMELQQE